MLRSYDLAPQERVQAAQAIYKEGKRLETLSTQLLELYVYQNEEIALQPIFLPAWKRELENSLHFLSEKYSVAVKVAFPKETILGNPTLLASLLCNLADNAMKASKAGDTVSVGAEAGEHTVRLFVRDTGVGIDPQHLPHLTDPFYREDKARSRALGGAGLGLSLCKEIASLHETSLSIVSEKGKGTEVSFSLRKAGDSHA